MNWSPQQQEALDKVAKWLEWLSHGDIHQPPIFRLFGYAGTGKTTLARHFAEGVGGIVRFACFTGKAALVLRRAGCPSATTIHSLIYIPRDKCRARLRDLEADLDKALDQENGWGPVDDRVYDLEAKIEKEREALRQPSFSLNPDSDLEDCSLLILDEVSMVGERMAKDILSFGIPVLALGDPAQLPPVGDGGYFTDAEPDVMLTEIHRQVEHSPIIRMATDVREGRGLLTQEYGPGCRVVQRGTLTMDEVCAFDQVLVGTNAQRRSLNARIRANLGRVDPFLPEAGDRLVCLKNNHDLGLLNGGLWDVLECRVVDDNLVLLTITDSDEPGEAKAVTSWRHYFEGRERELHPWAFRDVEAFTFGYALTVHKAQGSQWPSVMVVDESAVFRDDAARWTYTAITRASERLTVVR